MTSPRVSKSVVVVDQCKLDHVEEGVDAKPNSNADAETTFPESSCVTSTRSRQTTFLLNKELSPIKMLGYLDT